VSVQQSLIPPAIAAVGDNEDTSTSGTTTLFVSRKRPVAENEHLPVGAKVVALANFIFKIKKKDFHILIKFS
jgi:hypothetical protein